MEIFDQIWWLINKNKNLKKAIEPNSTEIVTNYINTNKKIIIPILSGLILSYYILSPTINPQPKMFSKRPEKYTTGLVNLHNDCFANSSIQAYSSLPGFTIYLNEFISSFQELEEFLKSKNIDIKDVETRRSNHLEKLGKKLSIRSNLSFTSFDISLHIALAEIIKTLQETQLSSRTISAWTFLHKIEQIFNAKISRSQHDAHEFTQLINESLENENLKLKSIQEFLRSNLHELLGSSNPPVPNDYNFLTNIQIPEFPFSGLLLNQMQCLNCQKVSKPSLSPFTMLTLPTPQMLETELNSIIHENKSELIEGYQCLKCRISKIIDNENYWKSDDEETLKYLPTLHKLNDDPLFFINEDLDEDLENFIKNYKVKDLDISKVTSTVFNKTVVLKPPKVFGIHLSRSSFDGVNFTRNPCRVSFEDSLKVTIGKEYHQELRKFSENENEINDSDIYTNLLTTDVNNFKGDDVQREDIDERGAEDEGISDIESLDDDSINNELNTLNNTPISADQTNSLRAQFDQFKFNESDSYSYRLKAIIRHRGSHTQGHYECFKRKPLFVKDKDGTIFKLSPEINIENKQTALTKTLSPSEDDESGIKKRFSEMIGRRLSVYQADPELVNAKVDFKSGAQSPVEVTMNQPDLDALTQDAEHLKKTALKSQPVKMKKIPSLIKYPFWRISDAQVSEVSKENVLCETSTVYMLYYERS